MKINIFKDRNLVKVEYHLSRRRFSEQEINKIINMYGINKLMKSFNIKENKYDNP